MKIYSECFYFQEDEVKKDDVKWQEINHPDFKIPKLKKVNGEMKKKI